MFTVSGVEEGVVPMNSFASFALHRFLATYVVVFW